MGDGGERQARHPLPPEFFERKRNVQDINIKES
jgi:hypothetical protein